MVINDNSTAAGAALLQQRPIPQRTVRKGQVKRTQIYGTFWKSFAQPLTVPYLLVTAARLLCLTPLIGDHVSLRVAAAAVHRMFTTSYAIFSSLSFRNKSFTSSFFMTHKSRCSFSTIASGGGGHKHECLLLRGGHYIFVQSAFLH